MIIGERLKQLREDKKMSQGEIEKRTGLLRCYLSRCENGHTVPSIGTLEKWAAALNVPIYQLFYAGKVPDSVKPMRELRIKDTTETRKMRVYLSRMTDHDRHTLLKMAASMARPGAAGREQAKENKPKRRGPAKHKKEKAVAAAA